MAWRIELKLRLVVPLALLGLIACTETIKVPQPTGGSRADASVVLSYQVGMFEVVSPDWVTAQSNANNRCRAWGYSKADPFEGLQNKCERTDMYGNCVMQTISRTYQCLG